MPLKDAAHAACVSHGFLRCWRHYPILILNNKTIGLIKRTRSEPALKLADMESYGVSKIDHIIENHSGIGVKVLKLELFAFSNISAALLAKWFEKVIKPGIEELSLEMYSGGLKAKYNFPCYLLSNNLGGGTIQLLSLSTCAFHTTVTLGCIGSLRNLRLCEVQISGEELGLFLSNSFALEQLIISDCDNIIHLKVPCLMQQLNYLEVTSCEMLEVIEIDAPKLSTFIYGEFRVKISLGHTLEVKNVHFMNYIEPNAVYYALTELPYIMPSAETLILSSPYERTSAPMVPIKFLHLKYLEIYLSESMGSSSYDFFFLVSFMDASPALETFKLHTQQEHLRSDSILGEFDGDHPHLRRMPECRHDNLKNVTITGFNSARSMTELTCHILKNAPSLECITLYTAKFFGGYVLKIGKYLLMSKEALIEAQKSARGC